MPRRHRAFVAQVPTTPEGYPDLNLPPTARVRRERPGLWHLYWEDHYAVVVRLGTVGDQIVIQGVGDRAIMLGLEMLGADVQTFREAWQAAPQWLANHGIKTTSKGRPIPLVRFSGDPVAMMSDDTETDIPDED